MAIDLLRAMDAARAIIAASRDGYRYGPVAADEAVRATVADLFERGFTRVEIAAAHDLIKNDRV